MSEGRPDPDALLARIKREEGESRRGRLRIYLGAFPGVGKTHAMLSEAQRRKIYGEDVVVGFVETHGRKGTAIMLDGLEIIPRKRFEYRGVIVEEMDVDAILERHPVVCLVDELAHTNAPGSERQKRYEDANVILDAGIDVVATLNVQHLESLNDVVESITGIKVHETLPDEVLDEADEVILIDLSPEGARARMQHGNIYPPEQARVALERFFKPENLAALRELALRRTAEEVDEQLDELMRERHARVEVEERVLAYIDDSDVAPKLIRHAWRLAQGLRAELLVVYSEKERSDAQQHDLAKTLELAEDLNARVLHISSEGISQAFIDLVKAEGVHHVVLPRQRQNALSRLLQGSPLDKLAVRAPEIDIHLVSG